MAKRKPKARVTESPEIVEIPVSKLRLDPENPRLASLPSSDRTQEQIVSSLWKEMAVDEVALSIAENGYYKNEPLLAIKDGETFLILEGNRRFAAVRLLREPKLRRDVGATALPTIGVAAIEALNVLPVMVFPTRESLWANLGFRHVNGTKQWDAFSKAEFVAHVHENYGVPLDEIARRIGDQNSTVFRFYRGYAVMKQAEAQAGFDRTDLWRNRFFFSHLYTAIDQPEFKKFLGLKDSKPGKNPVPKAFLPNLRELLVWIYGSRQQNVEPVVKTQAPDLNNLRRVIADAYSLSLLRQGLPLESALEATRDDGVRFRDAVVRAKEDLQKAKGAVATGYKGEKDLLEVAEAISTLSSSILQEMRAFKPSPRKR